MRSVLEYECPECGGKVEFDTASQQLVCPYCDSSFDPEDFGSELEAAGGAAGGWDDPLSEWTASEAEGMFVYHCDSCGGDIVGDETLASTHCPYCDNPVVMMGQFGGDLRPNYIIPFQVDKQTAEKAYLAHAKRHRLTPRIFRSKKHLEEVQGLYVPYWVVSCRADCDVLFKCEQTQHSSDKENDYYTTDIFHVERRGTLDFEHVPVEASAKHEAALLESLEPFDFGGAVSFNSAYLAGYLADRYDIPKEQSQARAEERIRNTMQTAFDDTLQQYDKVTVERLNIAYQAGRVDYCLLPIWFLNTRWQGKLYRFALNGQTGKLVGDLPIDKREAWKWRGIWFLVFLLLGLLIGYFLSPGCGLVG